MADILDSANAPTDDAAQTPQGAPPSPAAPSAGDSSLKEYVEDLTKNEPVLAEVADKVLEENLIVPAEPPPPVDKPKSSGKNHKMPVVALSLLFALLTTGLVFVFVNQQQTLNDIRNQAAGGDLYGGYGAKCDDVTAFCSNGYTCQSGTCKPDPNAYDCGRGSDPGAPVCCSTESCADPVCEGPNRLECRTGTSHCTIRVGGCVDEPPPGEDKTPTPTRVPTNTPTNTPSPTPIVAQCTNIKIYKDGVVVTPSTLKTGDAVVIGVTGGNATKARIRVNGGAWTETTTKNASGEYTLSYTLPAGVTNFTIESEIYGVDGVWK